MSSTGAVYSPPPGPPPGHNGVAAVNSPSYAPPPGSPPSAGHTSYQPPPGPPPMQQEQTAVTELIDSAVAIGTDAPPPYTAKASDPLPAWTSSTAQLQDISSLVPTPLPTHLPLDPPPAFFSTPSPPRIRARSFEPFTLPSRGRTLADGFAPLYAEALRAHGVAPDDWARFLQDLQAVARLAQAGLSVRGERPKTTGLGVGSTRGRAYDTAFVRSPLEQVQSLVEVYNGSAWERRKVRVTVKMRFEESGREGYELLVEAL